MVHFTQKLDMKTNLFYKSMNYEWQFTNFKMKETVENIVENILSEDIGTTMKEHITVQQLEKLKPPVQKMLSKKNLINNQLQKMIEKQKKKEESGSTIGILIFPLLQKLIPLDLIGGPHNRFHILKVFRKALKSGMKDCVPLKSFVKGLKTGQVCWLQSVQCNETKILMLAKLVTWLWKVTKSLIASKYYVTEAQGSLKLKYIPKKVWQSITDQKLNLMIHLGILKPITEEEVQSLEAKRRPAFVRWLPKSGGLRPIIFLKKDSNEGRRLINQRKDNELKAFVQFLMNKTKNPTRMKSHQLSNVWRSAVTKLRAGGRQRVHLVTVDVKDAYGSIIQEKLVAITRIASTTCFGSGNQDRFIKFTVTKKNRRDVFSCEGLCNATENKSTDKVTIVKLKDLLERLAHIVKCQTVKRMKKSYLIKKGISQAVPVSAALCDLFLGYFTKTMLAEFTANGDDTLIRAMDDFFYITPDRDRAELFLKKMSAGFPNFNIHIKQEKTQSTLGENCRVEYFGFIFDTNLEVYVKLNDGQGLSFRHTMTFTYRKPPIDTLQDKMQRIPMYKLNKLTLDPAYMSMRAVSWNVFHTACLMACCFKATVDTIGSTLFDNEKLLNCIRHSSASVAVKTFRFRRKNDIFIRELFWIVVRAFFLCLTKYGTKEHSFSGSLIQRLETMENEARKKVRPRLIEHISSFVKSLPSQFKTGY